MEKDLELLWEKNTSEARSIIAATKNQQIKVATLALEVCEISRGGSSKDLFTITRFAKEIGVNEKTLSTWMSVKKLCVDKLPKNIVREARYSDLLRTSMLLNKEASSKAVIQAYEKVTGGSSLEMVVKGYIRELRSLHYNFELKDAANLCDEKILQETLYFCNGIIKKIKESNRNIVPQINGISSKANIRFISINEAIGNKSLKNKNNFYVGDIKITQKDIKIINFIKRNKKFHSPTEIGMKLGMHSYNSASTWAYRTLNKLQSLDVVERNKHGHYRWSYKS